MFWHWLILLVVIFVGNFLGLGSMVIGFANSPAVLISGADIKFRGTTRYAVAAIAALLFQSIAAVTLSALIISYTRYITSDKGNILIWIVGTVGAIYPMWQTWSLARMERLTEPESYIVKEATHKAVPYSLIITVVFTLLFVFQPLILDKLYYWLLTLAILVGIGSVISIVMLVRRRSNDEIDQPEIEDLELEEGTVEKYERDALVAWKNGGLENALHLYNKAIELEPDNAVILLNRGNLQIELGNFDEGISDLERASEINPELPTHNAILFKDMSPEMRESVRQRMLEKPNG